MELFEQQKQAHEPLAARMRPRKLDEYIGQEHIVGKGRLLRRLIQVDRLSSIILSGPPGTGKTTLARVIAAHSKSKFFILNAVLSGISQLREVLKEAEDIARLYQRRSVLFIDEVHRWNKSQQDALLPSVENGTVIFIGATTENPYFEVNNALVSRSRVFQLNPLEDVHIHLMLENAIKDQERGYGALNLSFEEGALEHIVRVSEGDGRNALNALELAVESSVEDFPPAPGVQVHISKEACEESIQKKALLYDKDGDYHYDSISAFIKSIRGSDPDAALYWLTRMIRAGENPRFLFRRMIISASEDIGLADPQALVMVESAAAAFDRVGMPEGQFFLAQACVYLATARKSNSLLGYFQALESHEKHSLGEVPNHLKDGNRDSQGFGHGEGYKYPHAYRDHWTEQAYLPKQMMGKVFYQPGTLGFEGSIASELSERREAQLAAFHSEGMPEVQLKSSHGDHRQVQHWASRAEAKLSKALDEMRNKLFAAAALSHSDAVYIGKDAGIFLLLGAMRIIDSGATGIPADVYDTYRHYFQKLEAHLHPSALEDPESFDATVELSFNGFFNPESWQPPLKNCKKLAIIQLLPAESSSLSDYLREELAADIIEAIKQADPRLQWNWGDLKNWIGNQDYSLQSEEQFKTEENRKLHQEELVLWLQNIPEKIKQMNPAAFKVLEKSNGVAGKEILFKRTYIIAVFNRN
jgi:putative ATPase